MSTKQSAKFRLPAILAAAGLALAGCGSEDGTATMSFHTDRLDESLLIEGEEGTAVMVHSDPDNFANVPERYLDGDEPDEDTLNTGDAGDRLACGVIEG